LKQRLDALLHQKGLANSRTQAAALVMAGRVLVEGKLSTKPGYLLYPEVSLRVTTPPKYVSRAGEKLESVAAKLGLVFKGKTVLDVGSSTGGFTDYALQSGARKVYAVDVGRDQLEQKIREHPQVVAMERTDIRNVEQLPEPIELVLVDVSFISLRLLLVGIKKLLGDDGEIVAMVKPQFEANRKTASMHKGVIKNDTIRRQIFKDFEQWVKAEFKIIDKADSKVAGAKGNLERFYRLKPLKQV
jgi:23S rRNA (cytidine1920-2'-O)/16S rRNA (cytidine1409-2'-O)-methyltransferase